MTNRSTFHSDDELIKRLKAVVLTAVDDGDGDATVREARDLASELAERIYADPGRWGIASIPEEHRDDAVSDAFVAMLYGVQSLGGRQPVTDWFGITAESRFRRLWSLADRQSVERERIAELAKRQPAEKADAPEDEPEAEPSVFEVSGGVWERFEGEFARDAFVLRLRYLLKRSPEEIAVMLDAPSARAIGIRITRARDRFRMFCEQSGMARHDVAGVMAELAEEPSA